jgi:uncharacterized protein (TIRG00374 family)
LTHKDFGVYNFCFRSQAVRRVSMNNPSTVETREAPGRNEPRPRRWLGPLVKLLISGGLIALLVARIDGETLWRTARTAAPGWLAAALGIYLAMILASAWRWDILLRAQHIRLPFRTLASSFLVATFFNNFLPSNIGGDVVRISDTAGAAGSKTLATTIVLMDRGIGLLGLVMVAAIGASAGQRLGSIGPVNPMMLWLGLMGGALIVAPALVNPRRFVQLLQPLKALHAEWVEERLERLAAALARFRQAPGALATCFAGALAVQTILVGFYLAIAYSMGVNIGFTELAFIVPITFIVQMVPISVNGFGVREATFGFYFNRLGLPLESALLVSFMGAALIMLFSLTGAVAYLGRRRAPSIA